MPSDGTARRSLLWRVFAVNAAVLAISLALLAVTPATVSFPLAATEAVVLALGLAVMLVVNLWLLRRAFAPLGQLARLMRDVDLLEPGRRIEVQSADREVTQLTRAFNEMLDRLEAEHRESGRRALGAQEDERRRVAMELHDEVGQTLTAVVLQLQRAGRGAPDGVRGEVEAAREAVRQGLEEVRGIARRLRPEALDDLGLVPALASFATRLSQQTGLVVERSVEGDVRGLSPEAELVVYRVAQESLTNVVRHARAHTAELRLKRQDGKLVLTVRDDGDGIDQDAVARSTNGILGMRERAVLVGGRVSVSRRDRGGTEVRLEVPAS